MAWTPAPGDQFRALGHVPKGWVLEHVFVSLQVVEFAGDTQVGFGWAPAGTADENAWRASQNLFVGTSGEVLFGKPALVMRAGTSGGSFIEFWPYVRAISGPMMLLIVGFSTAANRQVMVNITFGRPLDVKELGLAGVGGVESGLGGA